MDKNIIVYSKNNCSQCRMTKIFLNRKGIEFIEINLDEQPSELVTVKEMGFSSLPVVVIPNHEPFFGFRPDVLEDIA